MSFGHFIDPQTQRFTDDHLIGKAFECLRVEFGDRLPEGFFGRQWWRAKLVLEVEGRSTQNVVNAIRPFAVAQSDSKARAAQADEVFRRAAVRNAARGKR